VLVEKHYFVKALDEARCFSGDSASFIRPLGGHLLPMAEAAGRLKGP